MPNLAEMLTEDQRKALMSDVVLADVKADQPASARAKPEFVVTKKATDPNPGTRLPRSTSEVVIDPESEAMIDALCSACSSRILIDPQVPAGIDPDQERKFLCASCGRDEVDEAIVAQRNVETIKRTRIARHQPRITDGINHPVVTTKKETPMFDLDNITDADLGALVRERMKQQQAERLRPARKAAKEQVVQAERQAVQEVQVAREERKGKMLAAFQVGTTLEVPTLDLSEITSLDEMPSAKERSPYNKARFRLAKEGPLDAEDTTYRVLVAEHERLQSLAGQHDESAAQGKQEVPVVQGTVNVDEVLERKVAATMETLGITETEARNMIAALGR